MDETLDLSFYKEALLFLATAGVVAPLFFRLRVSPVLGYLFAGVALGPHGLGALARATPWLTAFTIGNVATIDRIAAFGVVTLLFTMGIELSFERIRRMRRLVFGLGLAQVVVTTLALTAAAFALGLAPASALMVGAALSMSSTAIVIPVLIEGKRLGATVGRATFAVLLFQDLAVAPFLVMAGAFSSGGGRGLGFALLETLVPAVLALGALIVFGRLALRPFFHFVAETRSAEFFMAACLLVVLGDGLLAAASHLSMALGAFVAGPAAGGDGVPPRDRGDDRAVQGPAARALFRLGRGRDRSGADLRQTRPHPRAGRRPDRGEGGGAVRAGARLPYPLARLGGQALMLGPGGEFGFVMIGAALAGGLIARALSTTLVAAVAVSMLAIPALARVGALIDPPSGRGRTRRRRKRRREATRRGSSSSATAASAR